MPRPTDPNGTIEWVETFDREANRKTVTLIHRNKVGKIRRLQAGIDAAQEEEMRDFDLDALMALKRTMLEKLKVNLFTYNEPEPIFPEWFFDPNFGKSKFDFSKVNWLKEGF
jgi:hypothetical protein